MGKVVEETDTMICVISLMALCALAGLLGSFFVTEHTAYVADPGTWVFVGAGAGAFLGLTFWRGWVP
jgi:hypothetical protein